MALDFFRVDRGLQIGDSTQIMEGAVAPTVDAPVGSVYTETTNGVIYVKIAAGSGADKWDALSSTTDITSLIAAETTARIAADTTLQNNINAEVTARTDADTTLQNNINAEVTARTDADAALSAAIAAETTARIAGDATNAAAIAAETTARIAGDATNAAAIAAETTARADADAALNARIDALGNAFNYVGVLAGGASAGTATDLTALPAEGKNPGDYYKVTTAGYFNDGTTTFYKNVGDGVVWNIYGQMDSIDNTNSQVQGTAGQITVTGTTDTGYVVGIDAGFIAGQAAAIAAEATARQDADALLQAAVDAETTARIAGDAANAAAIAAETTARIAADTTLQNNINAEVTARTAADAALQAAIDAEVTARVDGDAANAAAIAAETTARIAADTALQTAIDAEVTARQAADVVISNNLTILDTFVQRDGKVTTGDAVLVLSDSIPVPVSAAQWIVHVQSATDASKVVAYEVFAASSGSAVDFTRFGILKLNNGVPGVSVSASINGSNGIDLSVTSSGAANIKIKRVAVV